MQPRHFFRAASMGRPIVRRFASEFWRLPHRIPESPDVSFTNPIDKHMAAVLARPGCPVCNNVAERELQERCFSHDFPQHTIRTN
jgi:hypothetical protein